MRDRGLEEVRRLPKSPCGGGTGCVRSRLTSECGKYLLCFWVGMVSGIMAFYWETQAHPLQMAPSRALSSLGSVPDTQGRKERLLFCVEFSLGMQEAWECSCQLRWRTKASLSRSLSQVWQKRFADIGGTQHLLLAPVRRIVHLF